VVPPEVKGPIPFDVHHSALANARTKAATEAVQARDQQWQAEAGWVLQLPQDRRSAAAELVRDFYANPAMLIANVYSTIKDHPQWGPQLRALLGTGNGNGHAAPAEGTMPQPDVEVIDPRTNQVVSMTYSEKALAQREALLKKQYEQSIEQRLRPFEQDRQAAKDREAQAEFDRKASAAVEQSTTRILKILEDRTDLVQHVNTLLDQGMHWLDAALQVREQHLKPIQQQQATTTAADVFRRKAAANTANGAGAPVTPMVRIKDEKDLARHLEMLDRG
jgi:hypothetical protein